MDIQALRAVAVVSVLLYHVWPDRLPGGYVGVDIFFVISGFLIVTHILDEISRTGTVRLGQFWARRARRLLPASLLTLAVTTVAVAVWVPRGLWSQFYREIVSAGLYVENWRLAHDAVDYLGAENLPSPVQHYWTLSAEEQFYVLIPVLLAICALVARRRRSGSRGLVLAMLVTITLTSLVYCLALTGPSHGLAYFSTFSRAWEFSAGALLAFVASRARHRTATLATTIGLLAIGVTLVAFDGTTRFPGPGAMLPVAGVVLALAFGNGTFLQRVGTLPPVAFLGRTSFAIYLWHFPLLILVPFALGHPLHLVTKVGIVVLTLVLGYLSTRFVEDPVRFSPRLLGGRRPRTVALVSIVAMVAVVGLATSFAHAEQTRAAQARGDAAHLLSTHPRCLGAQAMDPVLAPCANPDLDEVLLPDPADRADDDANRPECWSSGADPTVNVCHLGPPSGYTKHLLAIGDSHNNALIDTYEAVAQTNGWRIDVTGHGGCYWTTVEQRQDQASVANQEGCEGWRSRALEWIDSQTDLDAILVTHSRSRGTPVLVPGEKQIDTVVRGQVEAWGQREDKTVRILALRDNPLMPPTVRDCLDRDGLEAASRCAVSRRKALKVDDGAAQAVALDPNARLIDLTDLYCTPDRCPPVIGHTVVYRDDHHLTAVFAATLAPYLSTAITEALAAPVTDGD